MIARYKLVNYDYDFKNISNFITYIKDCKEHLNKNIRGSEYKISSMTITYFEKAGIVRINFLLELEVDENVDLLDQMKEGTLWMKN